MEEVSITVQNGAGYAATAGAVFYLNPRTRNNSQSNKFKIINETNREEINATWSNMSWGNDGWVTDTDGNKALKIPSRGKVVIDL